MFYLEYLKTRSLKKNLLYFILLLYITCDCCYFALIFIWLPNKNSENNLIVLLAPPVHCLLVFFAFMSTLKNVISDDMDDHEAAPQCREGQRGSLQGGGYIIITG